MGVEASARQTFLDAVVERYIADLPQLVILGAGFDTRAFRLPKEGRVRVFEVDAPETQAIKCKTLEKVDIDSSTSRLNPPLRRRFIGATQEPEPKLPANR